MDIQLTGRRLKITQPIRDYVGEKVEKAQKYFDHIIWAQVVLFIEKRFHKAEIVIHAPRQTFRAMAAASDLYSAVDLASDKIDKQLKKYKERLQDHHKAPAATKGPESVVEKGVLNFSVTKKAVSAQTAEEAADEMESLGHSFLLYQDRETGQVQLVYRKSDETYGILQPVKKGKH